MSEKQLLLPLEPIPPGASDEDSPEAALTKAVAVLQSLHHTFSRNPTTGMMLNLIYSDIAYALDPTQLIATQAPAPTKIAINKR